MQGHNLKVKERMSSRHLHRREHRIYLVVLARGIVQGQQLAVLDLRYSRYQCPIRARTINPRVSSLGGRRPLRPQLLDSKRSEVLRQGILRLFLNLCPKNQLLRRKGSVNGNDVGLYACIEDFGVGFLGTIGYIRS